MRNWEVAFFWTLIPVTWIVLMLLPVSLPWLFMAFAALLIEVIWILVRLEQKRLIQAERDALVRERMRKRTEQFMSRRWLEPIDRPDDQA